MTSGFGVDRSTDGTSGTTSQDIRKINGALYKPGIISGCVVTRSGSSLTYSVTSGVVAISTGSGEIVLAPVAAKTFTVTSPSSGSRTDVIYAQQRYPSIEGDAEVYVGAATSLPARSVELRTFIVPQGASNTNQASSSGGIDYSIPYGASLGVLHRYVDTTVGKYSNGISRKGSGTIRLPTDRRLRFSLTTTLYAKDAIGYTNLHYAEYAFLPSIDDGDICIWQTPGLGQSWATYSFEAYLDSVPAGTHTVGYGGFKINGGDTDAWGHYGVDPDGYGRTGTTFTVTDVGPAV